MKAFITLFLLLNLNTWAGESVCQQLASDRDSDEGLKVLGSVDVLSRDTWYKTDVILSFSYDECLSAVKQELVEYKGVEYYRFRTVEDHCDGGNTYGAIYTKDLSTPIAHIYDSDLYCEGDWNEEETYTNNKCNKEAMVLAEKKMKDLGLPFKASHARVEVRSPYIYDFIHIEGNLTGADKKGVTVKALVQTESCKFSNFSISYLNL